jgi:hypothetical protein
MFQANMKVIFFYYVLVDGGPPWQCEQGGIGYVRAIVTTYQCDIVAPSKYLSVPGVGTL